MAAECGCPESLRCGHLPECSYLWFRFHMGHWWGAHHIFVACGVVRERNSASGGKRIGKAGPTARCIAWNIDGKFQQQRVALRTVEYQELVGGQDDVPFLKEEGPLPLSFDAYEEKVEGRKRQTQFTSRRQRQIALSDITQRTLAYHKLLQMASLEPPERRWPHTLLNTTTTSAGRKMRRFLKTQAALLNPDALGSAYKGHNRFQASIRVPI